MNQEEILNRIRKKAKKDARNRRDPRFVQTMGFLVAKGFLRANYTLPRLPNQRLHVADVIWAGKNVEPRILEVLPAAIVRLEAHFHLDVVKHQDLIKVVAQLREGKAEGDEFCGIPYEKFHSWLDLKLADGRTRTPSEKKITKTFRLSPKAIKALELSAKKSGRSMADILEERILAG